MKSIINDLDITPLLRFLLQRNVLFSNPFSLFFHFLPPFFLLLSSHVCFHQSINPLSISFNSFLISSNTLQTPYHPTHIAISPYTSLVIPSSSIRLLLFSFLSFLVILLLFLLVQTLLSIPLHFLDFPFFPKCLLPL